MERRERTTRSHLESQHKILQESSLLSFQQPHEMIHSQIRLSHGVGLTSESMFDVSLSSSPGLFSVEEDGLFEAATGEGFLGRQGKDRETDCRSERWK